MAGRDTEKLQPLVDRLRLSRSVHLLGFRTDVPRLLAALDLFVMPSLQEGAATAVREAMAAGVAAIGTDVGGIPESIRDGETGLLVPPSDSQALAQAMGRLLAEPQQARVLAERGRAFVREAFSLERAVGQTEDFYRRLRLAQAA
jgi:glycosyltransferase involved in cell wall biosynthesis